MADKMFCPRCAQPFSAETSFCRTCGMSLTEVAGFVAGDGSDDGQVVKRPNPKLIRLGISLFIFGTFLGLLHAALRELALFPESYGKIVFLSFLAAGMLSLGLAVVFPASVYKRRRRSARIAAADEPVQLKTTELEPQQIEAAPANSWIEMPKKETATGVPSVTEHTTRNLS